MPTESAQVNIITPLEADINDMRLALRARGKLIEQPEKGNSVNNTELLDHSEITPCPTKCSKTRGLTDSENSRKLDIGTSGVNGIDSVVNTPPIDTISSIPNDVIAHDVSTDGSVSVQGRTSGQGGEWEGPQTASKIDIDPLPITPTTFEISKESKKVDINDDSPDEPLSDN
jgi:hypothetical protein